jgi:hypothetical protein
VEAVIRRRIHVHLGFDAAPLERRFECRPAGIDTVVPAPRSGSASAPLSWRRPQRRAVRRRTVPQLRGPAFAPRAWLTTPPPKQKPTAPILPCIRGASLRNA